MKFQMNWGTGIVIAFIMFILFIVSLGVYISMRPNDLIKKDYYEDELKLK